MKTRVTYITLVLLALLAGVLSLSSCNTWKGAGKDVQKTGEAMQGD